MSDGIVSDEETPVARALRELENRPKPSKPSFALPVTATDATEDVLEWPLALVPPAKLKEEEFRFVFAKTIMRSVLVTTVFVSARGVCFNLRRRRSSFLMRMCPMMPLFGSRPLTPAAAHCPPAQHRKSFSSMTRWHRCVHAKV